MNIAFAAADGVTLNGQIIAAKQPKAVVLLNPGTATQTSLFAVCAFLAEHGYTVMLWNYRGFGESRTRQFKRQ